jgi:hypothetical protein
LSIEVSFLSGGSLLILLVGALLLGALLGCAFVGAGFDL